MKKSNKYFSGFTLVEMMVVVAIIAILASVFLIGLQGFRGSAYDSRRLSDLQKIQSYLELYYNQQRQYPNTSDWATLQADIKGAQIGVNQLPNDPVSGQTYSYAPCLTGSNIAQSYVLSAIMSDKSSSIVQNQASVNPLCGNGSEVAACPGAPTSLGGSNNGQYCVSP